MENKHSDSLFNANIYKWLRENKSPDILCLQEFYHSDFGDYDNTLDSIVKLGGYKYFYMNPGNFMMKAEKLKKKIRLK